MVGLLSYNSLEDRYGLLVDDCWYCSGFHCGDCFEVLLNGEFYPCRMELLDDRWFLVGPSFFLFSLESVPARL